MEDLNYGSFTFFNESQDNQKATIDARRAEELYDALNADQYTASITEFCIPSELIPVFVPRLVSEKPLESYYNTITTQAGENNYDVLFSHTGAYDPIHTTTLAFGFFNQSHTDITFLNWKPETPSHTLTYIQNPNRNDILKNTYYHSQNSSFVCLWIMQGINQYLATIDPNYSIIITGNETGFTWHFSTDLITDLTNGNCEIVISDSLKEIFPINTVKHHTLQYFNSIALSSLTLPPPISLGLPSKNYYSINSLESSNMFPFSSLAISGTLNIKPEQSSINTKDTAQQTKNILVQYGLNNVSNPDTIKPKIIYSPETYNYWLNMFSSASKQLQYNFYFELITKDDFTIPILMKPFTSCSLKLLVKEIIQ